MWHLRCKCHYDDTIVACDVCMRGCTCNYWGEDMVEDCEACQFEEAARLRTHIEAAFYEIIEDLKDAKIRDGPLRPELVALEVRLMECKWLEDELLDIDFGEAQSATRATKELQVYPSMTSC